MRGAGGKSAWAAAVLWVAWGAWVGPDVQAAQRLEPDQLFEKVSPSVWSVVTLDRESKPAKQGSAVVVARETAITNCHVIEGSDAVLLRRENVMIEAEVQYVDTPRDLCQLRVPNLAAPSVEFAPPQSLRVGARAYAIGNPRGLENTMSDGIVSGIRKYRGTLEAIQTTAPISPGSSGGGLFDDQGRLIGITTFSVKEAQNLNFAMPAAWITELPVRHAAKSATPVVAASSPPSAPASEPERAPTPVLPSPPHGPTRPTPSTLAELRPGDRLEYRTTERLTGISRSVVYRLDRVEGDRLVFNDGRRVESVTGGLLPLTEPDGGEIDMLTPERGWDRSGVGPGARWRERFLNRRGGAGVEYDLSIHHAGTTQLRVAAGDFNVVVYKLEGFVTRNASATGRYKATLWYSTALRRAVLFEVDTRSRPHSGTATFHIDERFELVHIATSAP